MSHILKVFTFLFILAGLLGCSGNSQQSKKIRIIIPLEHASMDEIIKSFKSTLLTLYHQPVIIKTLHAKNDPQLLHSIIKKMREENNEIIIPIGTSATLSTLKSIQESPIIGLGAHLSKKQCKQKQPCRVAIVDDEISPDVIIAFIHALHPHLKKITLIHSPTDSIYPQVEGIIAAGKPYGIEILHIMAATVTQISSIAHSISPQTEAIFILKDNLIVSGITTLAKIANHRNILLITSDQGSVRQGAGLALSVHESDIGAEGAKLAAAILNGHSICTKTITRLKKINVFVNRNALRTESESLANILSTANHLGYTVEFTDVKKP